MTVTANVHEAKTHLSRLLEDVERGDDVVIARRGTPVARLVPANRVNSRRLGALEHLGIVVSDDDLLAPLDGDDLVEWETGTLIGHGQP